MKVRRILLPLTAVFTMLVPASANAQPDPNAPCSSDNYLQSAAFPVLSPDETHGTLCNSALATVQADVFNPDKDGRPNTGAPGPPEPTTCKSSTGQVATYGKTVWFDFFPPSNGFVQIRAAGFDNVINVVPFDSRTGAPNFARGQCVNESALATEEFLVQVARRGSYTTQIGGVSGAGGPFELKLDFVADRDYDGVQDKDDQCDSLKGRSRDSGCPPRLKADATIRAQPTGNGVRVLGLTVDATKGSRVELRCNRGCRKRVKKARSKVRFGGIGSLPAGARVAIRVSKKGAIGQYIEYRITRGNFRKTERCMNPGSRKPRRRCG